MTGRMWSIGRRLVALVAACIVLLVARVASAHQVGLSKGEYTATESALEIALTFARADASAVPPGAAMLSVTRGGVHCRLDVLGSEPDQDGLKVRLRTADCSTGAYEVDHAPLFRALPSGHRHAAVVHLTDGTSTDALLYAGADLLSVAAPGEPAVIEPAESRPTVALRYVWLGITHILEGADHVVFLLGLLLIGGKLRHILAMVTAFTISHSITLALAVTGALAPSPSYVEPLIALSVAYVGVENFIVKDASKRWRITALFGLVHGFGFAGALAEVGIPKEHVPLALATFNVGVEMGQLMIIGLAYPVFSYLRKVEWIEKRGVRFASAAVVVAGLFWFVARVLPSS